MTLRKEIEDAREEIATDGYGMSVGEVMNLYGDDEIKINPAFQRLFRWNLTQKSRFIESLLLGIPIPPIFVYQSDDNVWELREKRRSDPPFALRIPTGKGSSSVPRSVTSNSCPISD